MNPDPFDPASVVSRSNIPTWANTVATQLMPPATTSAPPWAAVG